MHIDQIQEKSYPKCLNKRCRGVDGPIMKLHMR